jgi:hypothetical protein
VPSLTVVDAFTLMKGQKFLREHVFTRVERQLLAVKEGKVGEMTPKEQRKIRHRVAWETALAAEAAEAEVEKSSLGAWDATKKAVGEVEGEMAVDDATKALQQSAISPQQPWEDELTDRTR